MMKSKWSQSHQRKGRYFDLMSWYGFDRAFMSEEKYTRFLAFTNAIFEQKGLFRDGEYVSEDSFFLLPPPLKAKKYDLLCKANSKTLIMAERARYKIRDFDSRNIERLEIAVGNSRLDKENPRFRTFININIADFIVWEDRGAYIHTVCLAGPDERPEDIANITIELPKFNKEINELETELDKWLYLFKNLPCLNKVPAIYDEPVFRELFEHARLPL